MKINKSTGDGWMREVDAMDEEEETLTIFIITNFIL